MQHAISWFEIPATDVNRAQQFYEAVFQFKMIPMDMGDTQMRMFPLDNPMEGIGGAIVKTTDTFYTNSATDGVLIYLNGNPDVQIFLDRAVAAGGTVVVPKTEISPEYGDMAIFLDTEGNRIALHNIPKSMQS